MKNKNGFTLIEIIAVIAIIGLLLTMVTPKLMENYNDKKNKLYDATIKEIERLSKLYLTDNPNLYSIISEDGYTNITIEMLCNGKYISCPINNPKDNSNITGYVKVTYESDNYVYEFIEEE